MQLTEEQKQLAEQMGIDWSKIPWREIITLILMFLKEQQPLRSGVEGHFDPVASSHATFQATLQATQLAAENYQHCCNAGLGSVKG